MSSSPSFLGVDTGVAVVDDDLLAGNPDLAGFSESVESPGANTFNDSSPVRFIIWISVSEDEA